jgi:hypothetical protein
LRSILSVERALALVAAATLEAAWLTLAYVAVQWLTDAPALHFGLVTFAAAAAFGLLLARALREWDRSRFAAALVGSTVIAAIIGMFFIGIPATPPGSAPPIFAAHAGGWLLGLAVWRGTLHAELGDEAELSESVMRGAAPGLIVFWVIATASGMVSSVEFTAPAFVATIALIGAGLLSLGLARLANLEVEQMDRGARRRWVALLLSISGLVLLIAVPVAAVLGVPVSSSIEAVAGPVAPLIIEALLLLAVPFALLAQLLSDFVRTFLRPQSAVPAPTPLPGATASPGPISDLPAGVLDLSWLGIVALIALVAVALMVAAALARPPGSPRRARALDEERAAEPLDIQLPLRLPVVRLPRLRGREPRTASDAYRYALVALAGTADARLPGETPREHAARVGTEQAADLRRLAVDYQLVSFAGSELTPAEERRAVGRWRRIARRAARARRKKPATAS